MITKGVKAEHGESVVFSLIATSDDCYRISDDSWIVRNKLPLVHMMASNASGDQFFTRKQLKSLIRKLQEIDEVWDVACVQDE